MPSAQQLHASSGPQQIASSARRIRIRYWAALCSSLLILGPSLAANTNPPALVILSPTNRVLNKPVIQNKGYANKYLRSIHYDVFNAEGARKDEQAFVTDTKIDWPNLAPKEVHFQCFDAELATGTNLIVLKFSDDAGNLVTTNLQFIFNLARDSTPPKILWVFPKDGTVLNGDDFTLRGGGGR